MMGRDEVAVLKRNKESSQAIGMCQPIDPVGSIVRDAADPLEERGRFCHQAAALGQQIIHYEACPICAAFSTPGTEQKAK